LVQLVVSCVKDNTTIVRKQVKSEIKIIQMIIN
jgi:hypothetical protein